MLHPKFPKAARHGAVVVYVAVCMPILIAILALAIDAGMLYDRERHVQSAADAAALAAAGDLFRTYANYTYTDDGLDLDGIATDHALAVAAAHGYTNDGITSVVTVNISPKSGQFVNEPGYVEVIIEYRQQRAFSSIFGDGDLPVTARSVARGRWAPLGVGILLLDPSGEKALTVSGYAQGQVPESAVLVNSTDQSAAFGEGTNSSLTAESFEITGGVLTQGGGEPFNGPITTGVPPTPDPYRHIPEPDPSTMPARSKETATVVDYGAGYKTYYLEPGLYEGGLYFDGKSSVVMSPGIYYMMGNSSGGGFKFRGGEATMLYAEEVMVFNDRGTNTVTDPDSPDYPQISISGQAQVTWTPPSTGVYKGLSFFQARDQDMTIFIAGQGGMDIKGAFYARDALIDISGNGTNYIGTQFVAKRMTMRGNGTYIVPWSPETIQPVRDLKLVE